MQTAGISVEWVKCRLRPIISVVRRLVNRFIATILSTVRRLATRLAIAFVSIVVGVAAASVVATVVVPGPLVAFWAIINTTLTTAKTAIITPLVTTIVVVGTIKARATSTASGICRTPAMVCVTSILAAVGRARETSMRARAALRVPGWPGPSYRTGTRGLAAIAFTVGIVTLLLHGRGGGRVGATSRRISFRCRGCRCICFYSGDEQLIWRTEISHLIRWLLVVYGLIDGCICLLIGRQVTESGCERGLMT